jgi:hypothetical protein
MNRLLIYILISIFDIIYSSLESEKGFLQSSLKERDKEYSENISNLYSKLNTEVNALAEKKLNPKSLEYYRAKLIEKLIAPDYSEQLGSMRMLRGIQPKDSPEAFFNNVTFTDIITKLPDSGNVTETPWSGYYWPIRYGVGAVRYSKVQRVNSQYDFRKDGNKIIKTPKTYNNSISYYKQPDEFNKTFRRYHNYSHYISIWYSAAEKYDFYVGDYNFTLTNMLKSAGQDIIWDEKGDVPLWMGICHGWSVASYMEKRPNKTITLLAADNTTYVQFLPDDIKALSSIYWAEANYKSNFAGWSCKYKNKTELNFDPATGLILDYRCFGVSPATFHTAMANWVGINKTSLIFDPMADDNEIWNHPVMGYNVTYFNPLTNNTRPFQDAVVTRDEAKLFASRNKFINFTLANITNATEYLVGAKMQVDYLYETSPNHDNYTYKDFNTSVNYHYVLELDKDLRMIGGEWLYNRHPNYVFGPRAWDELLWLEDQYVTSFNGTVEELRNLTNYSRDKAVKRKSPLKQVIKFVIDQMYNENYTDPGIKFISDPDVLDKKYPPVPGFYYDFNVDLSQYTDHDGPQANGTYIRTELRPDGRIVRTTTRYVNITQPAPDVPGGVRQPDGTVTRLIRNPNGQMVRQIYRPTVIRQAINSTETIDTVSRTPPPPPIAPVIYNNPPENNPDTTIPSNPINTPPANDSLYNPYTYNPNNDPNPVYVNPNNPSEGYRLPDGVIVRFEERPNGSRTRYIIRPPTPRPTNNPTVPSNIPNTNPYPNNNPYSNPRYPYNTPNNNNPNTQPQPTQPQPTQPQPTQPEPTQPEPTQPEPPRSSTNNYPRTPGTHYMPDGTVVRTVINGGRITWYITRPARSTPVTPQPTNNDDDNLLLASAPPTTYNNPSTNPSTNPNNNTNPYGSSSNPSVNLLASSNSGTSGSFNPRLSYNSDNPNYRRYDAGNSDGSYPSYPSSGGNFTGSATNTPTSRPTVGTSSSNSSSIPNGSTTSANTAVPGTVTQPDGTIIRTVVNNGRVTRYITRPARAPARPTTTTPTSPSISTPAPTTPPARPAVIIPTTTTPAMNTLAMAAPATTTPTTPARHATTGATTSRTPTATTPRPTPTASRTTTPTPTTTSRSSTTTSRTTPPPTRSQPTSTAASSTRRAPSRTLMNSRTTRPNRTLRMTRTSR